MVSLSVIRPNTYRSELLTPVRDAPPRQPAQRAEGRTGPRRFDRSTFEPDPRQARAGRTPARSPEEALRADPGFSRLGEDTRAAVLERNRALGPNATAQRNLRELATTDGFDRLDPGTQRALLALQGRSPEDTETTRDTQALARSPQFQALPPAIQQQALQRVEGLSDRVFQASNVQRLAQSPGFGQLSQERQQRLLDVVGGRNDQVSAPANLALGQLLLSPGYTSADAAGQRAQLDRFMEDQRYLPAVASSVAGSAPENRTPFQISAPVPERYGFRTGREDADRYDVEFAGGQRIPIHMPRNRDPSQGNLPSVQEVAEGLASLPPAARARLRDVEISPRRNPDDANRQPNADGTPAEPSYMTADRFGHVTVYPTARRMSQQELNGSLIHESGHTLSLRRWGDYPQTDSAWRDWRTALQRDGQRPSQYARRDAGEDFAEAAVVYQRTRGTPQHAELRRLMPERFRILDAVIDSPP
jgi:hypothetical protein